jgi:predicted  nucleic acid-binding Zn-ribbon protein
MDQRKHTDTSSFLNYMEKQIQTLKKGNQREEAPRVEHLDPEVTAKMLESVEKLEKEFKSISREAKAEVNFLKQQIAAVTQEKLKLEQDLSGLTKKIQEAELKMVRDLNIKLPNSF